MLQSVATTYPLVKPLYGAETNKTTHSANTTLKAYAPNISMPHKQPPQAIRFGLKSGLGIKALGVVSTFGLYELVKAKVSASSLLEDASPLPSKVNWPERVSVFTSINQHSPTIGSGFTLKLVDHLTKSEFQSLEAVRQEMVSEGYKSGMGLIKTKHLPVSTPSAIKGWDKQDQSRKRVVILLGEDGYDFLERKMFERDSKRLYKALQQEYKVKNENIHFVDLTNDGLSDVADTIEQLQSIAKRYENQSNLDIIIHYAGHGIADVNWQCKSPYIKIENPEAVIKQKQGNPFKALWQKLTTSHQAETHKPKSATEKRSTHSASNLKTLKEGDYLLRMGGSLDDKHLAAFCNLLPKDSNIAILLDCCHSGAGINLEHPMEHHQFTI